MGAWVERTTMQAGYDPPSAALRPPSPADLRCDLDPATVDGMALAYHQMHCIPLFASDAMMVEQRHAEGDLAKARFLLMRLRDSGWHLVHDEPPA